MEDSDLGRTATPTRLSTRLWSPVRRVERVERHISLNPICPTRDRDNPSLPRSYTYQNNVLKFRVGKSNIFVVALKFLRWCFFLQ